MIVFFWIFCALTSAIVAKSKGRSAIVWALLGFLLGPFGLILALIVSANVAKSERRALKRGDAKECPYCAELVKPEATKCKHCGEAFAGFVA